MALPERLQLTYDDYCLLPADGKRHEIIEGEHYLTPASFIRHQAIVTRLTRMLDEHVDEKCLGTVLTSPVDVVLSPTNVVQPDIVFVASARRDVLSDANIQGAPDLVVEVLSPTTRRVDQTTKRKLYERFGVQEYWLVDPDAETVEVLRRQRGELAAIGAPTAGRGDVLESPLLPGLGIALADLFG